MKQPVSVGSQICCRKAILALLDQLTSFGQRRSTSAVVPGGWVQWALHNPSRCCSLLPLDGAVQNGLGIESSMAVTHPTIYGAKPSLTSMRTQHAVYSKSYRFMLYKSKHPVSQYYLVTFFPRPGLYENICLQWPNNIFHKQQLLAPTFPFLPRQCVARWWEGWEILGLLGYVMQL